jgi:hypothetical protein
VVGQVKVVGILMLVHGVTVILFGGLRVALDAISLGMAPPPGAGPGGVNPTIFVVISIAWGVMIAVLGVLNAVAGFRVMYFRNRVLGLVALFTHLIVLATCCCAITAMGMMIYGLIVLFQPDVSRAFVVVAQGATPEEVIGRYTQRYFDARDDYDDMNRPRRDWEDEFERRRDELDNRGPTRISTDGTETPVLSGVPLASPASVRRSTAPSL